MAKHYLEVLEDGYVTGSAKKGDKVNVEMSDADVQALVDAKKAKVLKLKDADTSEDTATLQARIKELESELAKATKSDKK